MGRALIEAKNLILTGSPGVGKTTLIKECVYPWVDAVGGFFTEEQREGGRRAGFVLKTFAGREALLASKKKGGPVKHDKYGIDVSVMDEIAVPAVEAAWNQKKLVVIDEIGPMEMTSALFCEWVSRALAGPRPLLATIRLKAEPFTSQIKKMSDTALLTLDRERRSDIKKEVAAWVAAKCR